ncbi:alpha/beta fold hydrolase [Paenibacillus flagellatus]|uniref:Alpha/beta hydrolase n=1 Tax=Paenibacillus flagellatus TaxID=2211139 RepID=A0A2V5KQ00_9BACL|nr:alpha/beta fold hydrolase [Paenibacillus flagellatus]PYI50646.1 alpha/beta hydrolase [Paenibacillus flagellatus]
MRASTIVWVHGWGASPRVWDETVRQLPGFRHRLFTYEGCSSVESMRERLRRTIRKEATAGPLALVGWSMGGMLALEAAMAFASERERADGCTGGGPASDLSVAAVGATLRFVGDDRTRAWPARIVRRMRAQLRKKPEETLRAFAEAMLSEDERAERQAAVRTAVEGGMPVSLDDTDFSAEGLDAGLGYLLEADLTERWERYRASRNGRPPVVWLHGSDDPICPLGALSDVPDDAKIVFAGAGHMPFRTRPEAFAGKLGEWLHGNR